MSDEVWTLWEKPPSSLNIDSEKSPQLTVHLAAIPNGMVLSSSAVASK